MFEMALQSRLGLRIHCATAVMAIRVPDRDISQSSVMTTHNSAAAVEKPIVVVGDSKMQAASLALLLTQVGYTVRIAHDGPSAQIGSRVFAASSASRPWTTGHDRLRLGAPDPRNAAAKRYRLDRANRLGT